MIQENRYIMTLVYVLAHASLVSYTNSVSVASTRGIYPGEIKLGRKAGKNFATRVNELATEKEAPWWVKLFRQFE